MSGTCGGSGVQVVRKFTGGGMRRAQKWTCDVCGRRFTLTAGGRLPRHKLHVQRRTGTEET